jgi:hypothetical protein
MPATLGFISVRQHPDHGYVGGYLIVNHLARPLEFHCTLPVKPTRAQLLLYGPTMDEFICGEQIAKALISKAKLKPDLVLADSPTVLSVTNVSDACVAFLDRVDENPAQQKNTDLRVPNQTNIATECAVVKSHRFYVAIEGKCQHSSIESVLIQISDRFDITEPFSRIVEALLEAHPLIKSAA